MLSRFLAFLRDNWVTAYFATAILLIVFAYGVAVGIYELFPYSHIRDGVRAARDWTANKEHYSRVRPQKHLRTARTPGNLAL